MLEIPTLPSRTRGARRPIPIFANGRQIGYWSRDAEGHLAIALDVGRDQEAAVLSAIKAALFH